MLRLGVRAKLLLASIAAIAIGGVLAYAFASAALDSILTSRMRDVLFERADLVAWQADQAAPRDGVAWESLARDLGGHAHCRVTLVGADGRVLGDSEAGAPTGDQRDQPEVREALRSGRGSATRQGVLYVAMRMHTGGVARLALPMDGVARARAELRPVLLIAILLAAAVAAALARIAGRVSTRAVGHLTDVANAMAHGDFDARAEIEGRDEFAELGLALDRLSDSLSVTVRQLRAERDRVGRILSGMQEGVLLLDASGKIAFVNPALRQMLLLGADCVGKTPFEAIQNEELKALVESAQDTSTIRSAELELQGLKPRRLLVRVVPLAGEPGGILAVFVDVTDIRRLESMRKDFVANASHELRTPVTAVRSAAETLRFAMESDPDAAGHFLDIIERNAERLHLLVEDLLDLSRIESREFRLNMEDEDLGEVAAQVVGLFRERAEKKKIQLSADVSKNLRARADRSALEQILTNLVDNALKYSPERTTVVVRAREEERKGKKLVRVSVVDTGPGIEEKHLPRLFERFYRVDKGRSRELGGTGLGLSIVKHLCDALGGSISVESAVGKGSTFSFTLPQSAPEKAEAAPAPPAP
jgi:two-component system phosphate regulon sensor histidine kinase PhoR